MPGSHSKKDKLKKKIAKVRKADQQDINRVKKWNSKTFNKNKELSGPTEPVFKPTANLRNRLAKIRKADGGVAPNYNNPSKIRKKKTTKAAGLGALGEGKLNRKTGKPLKLKPRKKTLDDYPTEKAKTAAGMANIGKKPWMQKDYLKKKGKHLEKTALRSNVNKGVNKVNPIKPTKKYKKPPQGPNPHADTPDEIMKNAEVAGRKNDTYIGKIKKKKKKYDLSKDDDFDVDAEREIARERMLERSQASAETQPQYGKIKKRIARIRKAGEQVDPRVKKRKTVRPDSPVQKVSQMKDRIAELKTAKEHSHSIAFRKHEGQYYRRASLQKQEGKYAKYWLLNAKQTNGNGWGVSPTSIAKNINKFIGRPFVVTAKQWVAESEYGEQFEHPYLPTNNIDQIINHQEKFRVGSIVDVVEKDGDYHAVIEINSKFANMMLPPFCSPAIFQNNPGEADGEISDWEALHLAGLMEDPAYGARIALLKGSCVGTAEACSIQFKAAKQTTMCPKKKGKLVRRINRLGD